MMKKTTDELLNILTSVHSEAELGNFVGKLEKLGRVPSFPEYLKEKMQERELEAGELWRAAQIPRSYGYNILSGVRKPKRDKVLALCLALNLSCEETQRVLKVAGAGALYPRRQRDAVIMFSLRKGLSVMDTNIPLDEFCHEPLG